MDVKGLVVYASNDSEGMFMTPQLISLKHAVYIIILISTSNLSGQWLYSFDTMDQEDMREEDSGEEDASSPEVEANSDAESDDGLTEARIQELRDILLKNPYDYEANVELIKLLRSSGELDSLREAREGFASRFPLTPGLWLEWINDEQKMISSPEEKKHVESLFERGVKDYVSVDLWLEYCQFKMSNMGDGDYDSVRHTISRGLSFVGQDVSKGSLLWLCWLEFEKILLQTMDEVKSEDRKGQIQRIYDVYKKQLSQPLLNMKDTYEEFKIWLDEARKIVATLELDPVKYSYEQSIKKLEMLTPFEEALISSDAPHHSEYGKYLEMAEHKCEPSLIQSVYERCLTENPLDSGFWIKYLNFLETKIKVKEISVGIFERAVRNCPWDSNIWIKYLQSLEGYSVSRDDVTSIFESSLKCGFPSADDYKNIWITYLDYVRRQTDFSDEKSVESLRKTFNASADHLATINGDPNFTILQYLAVVEARFCKSLSNAREIWENMMGEKHLSSQAQLWIEYFHLEHLYGDFGSSRKVLHRALQQTFDWPESIGTLILKLEREEGTSLQSYLESEKLYQKLMAKVNKRRESQKQKSEPSGDASHEQKTDQKRTGKKRKVDASGSQDSEASDDFKKPKIPESKTTKKEPAAPQETPSYVRPKGTQADPLMTIFVSNLDFSVDEKNLHEIFSEFGQIVDLRLVRNFKGLSKGFAYIEFKDIQSVRKSLAKDRMKIGERPVFITEVGKKPDFKFKTGLEKNKIFVSNMSFDTKEDTLRDIFSKYGDLKEVRLVTYRNGHSKGCAYVEFKDELSASNALKADTLLVGDKNIRVALSDPQKAGKNIKEPQVLGSATFSSRETG